MSVVLRAFSSTFVSGRREITKWEISRKPPATLRIGRGKNECLKGGAWGGTLSVSEFGQSCGLPVGNQEAGSCVIMYPRYNSDIFSVLLNPYEMFTVQ